MICVYIKQRKCFDKSSLLTHTYRERRLCISREEVRDEAFRIAGEKIVEIFLMESI